MAGNNSINSPIVVNGDGKTVGQTTILASSQSVTVYTESVKSNSRIFLTIAGFTGFGKSTVGIISVGNIINNVSFDILVDHAIPKNATLTINWLIFCS